MISNTSGKPELTENDPEALTQLIEIQLAAKRAEWKQAGARYRTFRSLSIFFVFLTILGSLFAFFLAISHVNEQRANRPPSPPPETGRR